MLYRPKYCCNCGERIERVDWKIFSSRKFCDLCETEFKFEEVLPRIVFLILAVFGVWGFGQLFVEQTTEVIISQNKTLVNDQTNARSPLKKNKIPGTTSVSENDLSGNPNPLAIKKQTTGENLASQEKDWSPTRLPVINSRKVGQKNINKTVYLCGATTKKGNPCSRKVKGGGRCWQHRGSKKNMPKGDVEKETP
jgi:hypothetical protein